MSADNDIPLVQELIPVGTRTILHTYRMANFTALRLSGWAQPVLVTHGIVELTASESGVLLQVFEQKKSPA